MMHLAYVTVLTILGKMDHFHLFAKMQIPHMIFSFFVDYFYINRTDSFCQGFLNTYLKDRGKIIHICKLYRHDLQSWLVSCAWQLLWACNLQRWSSCCLCYCSDIHNDSLYEYIGMHISNLAFLLNQRLIEACINCIQADADIHVGWNR